MLLVQYDIDNIEELSESAELVEESFDEAFCHTDTVVSLVLWTFVRTKIFVIKDKSNINRFNLILICILI